jgi:hypothetical protein
MSGGGLTFVAKLESGGISATHAVNPSLGDTQSHLGGTCGLPTSLSQGV